MQVLEAASLREEILRTFGIQSQNPGAYTGRQALGGGTLHVNTSPVSGEPLPAVERISAEVYERVMRQAQEAFPKWRLVPAPKRGEVIRLFGNQLRRYKEPLARLVSYEIGKTYQEALGEVQEMIDMCDFGVGLSRQLYGLTIASERPNHRMYEQWHPLGWWGLLRPSTFQWLYGPGMP